MKFVAGEYQICQQQSRGYKELEIIGHRDMKLGVCPSGFLTCFGPENFKLHRITGKSLVEFY